MFFDSLQLYPFTEVLDGRDLEMYSAVQGLYTAYDSLLTVSDIYYYRQGLSDKTSTTPWFVDARQEAAMALSLESQHVSERFFHAVQLTLKSDHGPVQKAEMIAGLMWHLDGKAALDIEDREDAFKKKPSTFDPNYSPEDVKPYQDYRGMVHSLATSIKNPRLALAVTEDVAKQLKTDLFSRLGVETETMPDLPSKKASPVDFPSRELFLNQRLRRNAMLLGEYGLAFTLLAMDKGSRIASSILKRSLALAGKDNDDGEEYYVLL